MRSILITGGSGYFGRAMVCRLLTMASTERICVYSRDEAKQAQMRQTIADPHQRVHYFTGDVRDQQRLRRALQGVDLVLHAAALKRIEVCEYDPQEVVKTNVIGTMNMIEAATDAKVKKIVALSTDKACQPRNAYGASKLMLEKLIEGANNARGMHGPMMAVTRYGNIAGSTGSVIPTWRAAMSRPGALITVSDPSATRFWMTINEAINLVLDAANKMQGGEVFVPKLPAYRLGDLLQAMNPDEATVRVVGLGRGEKLHERMDEDGPDSFDARRMSVDELRDKLKEVV